MSTFLFNEHVFGPIKSRRLGNSLGINLLSTIEKVCNFDCIYCECGFTNKNIEGKSKFCEVNELLTTLRSTLIKSEKNSIDAITYAGNGEPTLHPQFNIIAMAIRELRDEYHPDALIVLLTNGTTLRKEAVQRSLEHIDRIFIKLDAGQNQLIEDINKPLTPLLIEQLVGAINDIKRPITIQSMFLEGTVNGTNVSNTSEENINEWMTWLEMIQPEEVSIYSIDRHTPVETISSVSKEQLEQIASKVRSIGLKTSIA